MKSPTKRIFYHLEVTRGTFNTEMPIRTRLHTLPARRSDHPHTYLHMLQARRSAHILAHVRPVRLRSRRCAQKSLVAERYQAFSEAKCLS